MGRGGRRNSDIGSVEQLDAAIKKLIRPRSRGTEPIRRGDLIELARQITEQYAAQLSRSCPATGAAASRRQSGAAHPDCTCGR